MKKQDFDYPVDSARGEGFLELVEAGPVEVNRGDYAKAPVVTKSSDVVKNLLEKIKNKSEKYPEYRKYPLYLLIYTTQWNFALSDAQVCWFRALALKASRVATGSLTRHELRIVFRRREAEGVLPSGEAAALYAELNADIAAADIVIQPETADMEREFGVVLDKCFSQTPPTSRRSLNQYAASRCSPAQFRRLSLGQIPELRGPCA